MMKLESDPTVVEEKKKLLLKQLDIIETFFLKDKRYLTGDDVTIADIMCVMELNSVEFILFDLKDTHPKLEEYVQRVAERLNPYYDNLNKKSAEFSAQYCKKTGKDEAK